MKAAGLVRGAYLFLRFPRRGSTRPAEPDAQAQAFVDTVGELEPTDFPVTIDVEFPGRGRVETGMTAADALASVRAACDVVRAAYGAAPILYTSARVWREDLANTPAPDLRDCPLWLARYFWKERLPAARDAGAFTAGRLDPPVPVPWGDGTNWWVHQYQGDALGFPGFTSTVDVNRFNPMLRGATGDRVKWVQHRLGLPESGVFDAALRAKVVAHQQRKGLTPDGIIGPKTFAALCWS
jgi:GH25 family lysozyme M1 (1,4-beta-N-acetylmuramidase)